jgi:hypothetical protein
MKAGRMDELALHPTVKPIGLVADAIKDCSRRGEIVLDPFGGSGSTLIAAERTGRIARLIEFDPVYCDRIVRRYERLTGKAATHSDSGIPFEDVAEDRLAQSGVVARSTQICRHGTWQGPAAQGSLPFGQHPRRSRCSPNTRHPGRLAGPLYRRCQRPSVGDQKRADDPREPAGAARIRDQLGHAGRAGQHQSRTGYRRALSRASPDDTD